MSYRFLFPVALIALGWSSAFAESVEIEVFTPPKKLEIAPPEYPRRHRTDAEDGWVKLNFMVDPSGSTYDITVVDSTEQKLFERAAIKAVEGWRFEPAMLDGQAIDAAATYAITFTMSAGGTARVFDRVRQQFVRAMNEEDRKKAKSLLDELKWRKKTQLEHVYYHVSQYTYLTKWGTLQEQYRALRKGSFVNDDGRGFLPESHLTEALVRRVGLEARLSLYASALETIEHVLGRKIPDQTREAMTELAGKIEALRHGDKAVAVAGTIVEGTQWGHRLFKSSFTFSEVTGDIAELRLHCDKDYVGFVYTEGMQYSVTDGVAECYLTVIGDPGTTFQLVEI